MAHAAITGWGKCLPPAVLSNADLTRLFETTDEWILSRTGIRERRISHVSLEELAYVASARALAAAGLAGDAVEPRVSIRQPMSIGPLTTPSPGRRVGFQA